MINMKEEWSIEWETAFRKVVKGNKDLIIGLALPAIIKPETIDAL